MKQSGGIAITQNPRPEWHDLHITARASYADCVFAKTAFYLYQT